ncbi:MAG TPA: ABC transporter permease [Candidatus Saccharimonadales bacterium]|nr:ABC transporter permease [Candidatus Saccharimonadales bacterium]
MKQQFFTVWVFAKLNTRRFFRDKLALFFGIAFPVIFLFVFGFMTSGNNDTSFKIALINQSDTPTAKAFVTQLQHNKIFEIDKALTTEAAAKEKMNRNQLDATIVLPKSFGAVKDNQPYPSGKVQVVYTQNSDQAGQTLTSVLNGALTGINAKFVSTEKPFSAEPVRLANKSLSSFDYTFAGLLGFSIIGLGIFGPINVFPELKKQGILRRLHTTPIRVWQYFVSTALSQTIVGLVSLAVFFAVAIGVFHLNVVGNWLAIIAWVSASIVMILGIGLSIGGWAHNERQAAPLGNLIVFPMMFLSGTFFPRFLMPEWLQTVSNFLPLTPVIDGIRLIATEGKTFLDLGPQIALLFGWMVVIYIIAFRVFRWE